jgi:hypothetical protein
MVPPRGRGLEGVSARYLAEPKYRQEELELLRSRIQQGPVTLVFSARNREPSSNPQADSGARSLNSAFI